MKLVQPDRSQRAVRFFLPAVELLAAHSSERSQQQLAAPSDFTRHANRLLHWSGCLSVAALTLLPGSAIAQIAQTVDMPAAPPTLAQAGSAVNLLFVNPTVGNDASGSGRQNAPLRTITQALRVAQPNTVIMLAAGTYSAESGETFPLRLQPGVTVQGDPSARGEGILIRGGGTYASPTSADQNITILGANQAGLTGVTVTNPNPRGYGVWVESTSPTIANNTFSSSVHDGVMVVGNGAPLIQGNHFLQNGANGISLLGASQAEVRDNRFERTGYGINVAQNAAPRLLNNQVTQNRSGVVVQANARPLLRGNTIEDNQEDGLVAIAQAQPDLGTETEPGNNVFRSNGRQDINLTAARQPISTVGNQLESPPATRQAAPPSRPVAPTAPPAVSAPSRSAAPANPASTRPAPASSNGGFGNLPQLQPAPTLTVPPQSIAPPPTSQPATPIAEAEAAMPQINLVMRSTPAPTPAQPETTVERSQQGIAIPVIPPANSEATASTRRPATDSSRTAPQAAPQSGRSAAAIDIPVPPPASAAARPAAPLREVTVARPVARPGSSTERPTEPVTERVTERSTELASEGAIEIPVPPPETGSVAPRAASRSVPNPPSSIAAVPASNLLPVPGDDIPLGNIGGLPTIDVSRDPLRRTASLPPAANSSRAVAMGLRYRVVVEAESERDQAQVRSLVPGAFRTSVNGRVVMQAGAYSDRANADETAQFLNSSGLRAVVQSIE